MGKNIRSPSTEPDADGKLHIMWCGLVSQGDRYDTALSTPVSCSLRHDTFHLGLGRPESHLASKYRDFPHQGTPSTIVNASHMTQGRAEYESTIPLGNSEGLDLRQANNNNNKSILPAPQSMMCHVLSYCCSPSVPIQRIWHPVSKAHHLVLCVIVVV